MLLMSSCGSQPSDQPRRVVVSDRSHDAGAVPTNGASWALFDDPAKRRASLQAFLVSSGEQCNLVTEALLKGGFEGTDLWRVSCADSGDWLITVTDRQLTAVSCRKSANECQTAWASVFRNSL